MEKTGVGTRSAAVVESWPTAPDGAIIRAIAPMEGISLSIVVLGARIRGLPLRAHPSCRANVHQGPYLEGGVNPQRWKAPDQDRASREGATVLQSFSVH